jgi:hypothetical protein
MHIINSYIAFVWRIRQLAFFAVFCVACFNAAARPVEVLSAVKKNVLVLYGEPPSVPAK